MKRRFRSDNATPGARSETAPCEMGAGVNYRAEPVTTHCKGVSKLLERTSHYGCGDVGATQPTTDGAKFLRYVVSCVVLGEHRVSLE